MHQFLQDFRYAIRMLRKSAGLSAVIVLSLAIGIGANSAIFSVVDALLLRPLPYPHADRLANVWLHSPGIGIFRDWPSPGQFVDLLTENHSFEEMAIARLRSMTLTGIDQPERIDGIQTSSSLLRMLGAEPLLGRLLLPEEDKPGKPPVAVMSYRLWKRLFSGDPQIVGRSITMNGNSYTVAGVLRPEFMLNTEAMPSEGPMDKVDIFVPLPLGADAAQKRGDENYNVMVRLKPGVSLEQAQADVDVIANRIRIKDKRDRTFGMSVVGLQQQVVGDVRRTVLVLLGSVGLVLLIACANVANLLLTRAAAREKEIAVRTALGANGWRIVRQLLTESVLLSLLGGAAGLLIAEWALYLVRTINPGNVPRLEDIGLNGTVLAFTLGVAVITGILFGLAPALRALKVDLNTSLKSGGRSGQTDCGMRLGRNRLRGLLVVSELAFSLMLLVGAGLLVRSFARLQEVPPGFSPDHVISMQVSATGHKYDDDKATLQFFNDVAGRVTRLPGVTGEGLVSCLPFSGAVGWGGVKVEGYTPEPGHELQVDIRIASTDYFNVMKIPLVKGRFFSDHDSVDALRVVIIDENFSRRFWPHDDPIGKHLWFDPKKPMTIAGVVGAVKQYGLDTEGKIALYLPETQVTGSGMFLVARTTGDPAALASPIAREIHAADPNVVVYGVRTMQDLLHDSMARRRFAATMLGAFSLFALVLAVVGVYGVMSYLVSQSTHDIGVRVALGAGPRDIFSLVLRHGLELGAIGIGAGLVGAFALTRVLASLLFGVTPTDAVTFSAVALILALSALIASIIPSRRAISVDPMQALREE